MDKKNLYFLLLFLSLISCGNRLQQLDFLTSSEKKFSLEMVNNIINALEKKDQEQLSKLFSLNVNRNVKDLKNGINFLMNIYSGKCISKVDLLGSTFEDINDSKKIKTINRSYKVTTNVDTYIIHFTSIFSEADKDDNGLFQLQINRDVQNYRGAYWILHRNTPGILLESNLTLKDYLAGLTRALSNGNEKSVENMFSQIVTAENVHLKNDISDVIKRFSSYVDYDSFPKVKLISKDIKEGFTVIKAEAELMTQTFEGVKDSDHFFHFVYFQNFENREIDGFYSISIIKKQKDADRKPVFDKPGIFYY